MFQGDSGKLYRTIRDTDTVRALRTGMRAAYVTAQPGVCVPLPTTVLPAGRAFCRCSWFSGMVTGRRCSFYARSAPARNTHAVPFPERNARRCYCGVVGGARFGTFSPKTSVRIHIFHVDMKRTIQIKGPFVRRYATSREPPGL